MSHAQQGHSLERTDRWHAAHAGLAPTPRVTAQAHACHAARGHSPGAMDQVRVVYVIQEPTLT